MQTRPLSKSSIYTGHPRFEGANIGTWIGYKHVLFFIEEAVLHYFRERNWGPQTLFEEYGLCLEIVSSRIRLLTPLHLDDTVQAEIKPDKRQRDGELTLAVQLFIERDGEQRTAVNGTVSVLLLYAQKDITARITPEALVSYVHREIKREQAQPRLVDGFVSGRGIQHLDVVRSFPTYKDNTFVWQWRIPYFYCHYSRHIQHSGYIRLQEEVVDLFLADRGLSIKTMLDNHSWIPVVSDVRTEILAQALMEETIYTLYTVEDILKDVSYTAQMDCYVLRDGKPLLTASSRIIHGYAEIKRHEASLARIDAATIARLRGERV